MSDVAATPMPAVRASANIPSDLDRLVRSARWALGGFVLAVVGVSTMLPISGAVISSGIVVAREEARPIQNVDGGDVREVLVREGDIVKAGQVLMKLDAAVAAADFGIVDAQKFAAALRVNRLEAERDGLPFPNARTPEAATEERRAALADEAALVTAQLERRTAEIARLDEQRAQTESALLGLKNQMEARKQEMALLAGEIGELEGLNKKRLVPKSRLNALKRAASQLAGDDARALADIATSTSRLVEIDEQRRQIEQSTHAEILNDLREAESQLLSLNEKWTAVSQRLADRTIRAPIDGVVHELQPIGPGSVAQPGKVLMAVVPMGGEWLVEGRVAPQQIEHVHVGSPCAVRLVTADPQASSRVSCEVTFIGAAAEADPQTGAGFIKFRAKVTQGWAMASDARLLTGMPAEIFVETGSHSLLSYLIEPLTRQIERSLRES
ncbi:Type I secretion system membrane fusion protein PrsE [Alphaproteobacteria bacterium SO-S41]|nr:Type I secretion system membrane fusion protein PrsE [Alphaproteobacteria bacterium SO-S41]